MPFDKNYVLVGGHRGDCFNFYENTMPAFEAALLIGVDMIEMDVRLSKDNIPVVIHDATVDRTTNGSGNVEDMTLKELQALNAGDDISPAKIPLFSDFIEWASNNNLLVNVEIKEFFSESNAERCKTCVDSVIAEIEEFGMSNSVVINSFDAWILEYIKSKYKNKYKLHGHYPYTKMRNINLNPDTYLDYANISDILKKDYYRHLLKAGIEPWVGANVTQESKLKLACEYGAKVITINNPADAIIKLSKLKLR